ncbi:MAG: orotidine-5'-phosphate decarboxylase [Nitrososphaera sp.]|nr:orotidine-5'-phosphate decarboxylase [Nitrososphaera sp.]
MSRSFREKLESCAETNRSLLCVGLDPDRDLMPAGLDIFEFNKSIIDATKDLVCAFKPNVAFYDGLGEDGRKALYKTIEYIPSNIPIIGDSKRGDVQPSSRFHARAMFDEFQFDAATINPYGGHDAVRPFLDYSDKGIFVWCRSSNPGAKEIQDLKVVRDDSDEPMPLYIWIAQLAAKWDEEHHNVGLVVGATYPQELKEVRKLCKDMPILIPGVGAQRGPLELSILNGIDSHGRNAIINVSRGIIYASQDKKDFDQVARQEAEKIQEFINNQLGFLGQGWNVRLDQKVKHALS